MNIKVKTSAKPKKIQILKDGEIKTLYFNSLLPSLFIREVRGGIIFWTFALVLNQKKIDVT